MSPLVDRCVRVPAWIRACILLVACAASAAAGVPNPGAIESTLEHAYLRGDSATIRDSAQALDAALARQPRDPELQYTRGFASFAAAQALRAQRNHDPAAIARELERAVGILETVHGEPWESEAMALAGAIDGQLIGLKGGMTGMKLGPKATQLTQSAVKRRPDSPRVLLFRAQILANTPALFGGDRVAAAALYRDAVAGFAAGQSGPGPRWGQVEALTWLGLERREANDIAGARRAWEQALAIEPDARWLKFALLPKLPHNAVP